MNVADPRPRSTTDRSVPVTDTVEQIVTACAAGISFNPAALLDRAALLPHQLRTCTTADEIIATTDDFLQDALSLPFVGVLQDKSFSDRQQQRLAKVGIDRLQDLWRLFNDSDATEESSVEIGQPFVARHDGLSIYRFDSADAATTIVAVDVQPLEDAGVRFLSVCLTTISQTLSHFSAATREMRLQTQTGDLAAVVDLVQRCAAGENEAAAACTLVDCLKQHLCAAEVLLGRRATSGNFRLLAMSDRRSFDPRSDEVQQVESVMLEAAARDEMSVWPASDANNRHALRCHQQFATDTDSSAVVSVPLAAGSEWYGCLVVRQSCKLDDEWQLLHIQRFLNVAQEPLAAAIAAVDRSTRPWFRRVADRCRQQIRNRTSQIVTAIVLIVASTMFIPVDYKVDCNCELQPTTRRFVATPFDAPLSHCLVQPGDVVEQGQLLAELDGRELRWELAAVNADLSRAAREHDAFLAEQNFGKAAIARHEMERLQNRSALLQDRSANLQVVSPISGIVVAGDWKDSEGVPLETGDSLFEIAPLDRLQIEIGIPEDDIRHVQSGMPLQLQLNSMPGTVVDATVERIYPKAELIDDENVFVAEAAVESSGLLLKPGMRGEAEISTGARPLGWNLFHKAWATTRYWLGW